MQIEQTSVMPVAAEPTKTTANKNQIHLVQAVRAVNRAELFGPHRELVFNVDNKTHRMIIRIKDKENGEVLQQIPEQYVLDLAAQYATEK
jgi:uncharacterized FlaG/YvyC family protein